MIRKVRQLAILMLALIELNITGCGWRLRTTTVVPLQMKKMIFDCRDPNSFLSRAIRNQLYLNGIELVDKDSIHQNIPLFRILNFSLTKDKASIFQEGYIIEYWILLSVNAMVLIPNKDIYPISIQVYRSFFENLQLPLAMDVEQQIIINEMYNQAAEQLIRKLPSIHLVSKDTNTTHSVSLITSNPSEETCK